MEEYSSEDGAELIMAARGVIELQAKSPKFNPEMVGKQFKKYNKLEQVVVRLVHHPTKTVRATSAIIDGEPLINAVINASLSAAYGPQNSVPISTNEIDELAIEINLLSTPKSLSSNFIRKRNEIEVGKHGLILNYGIHRCVLLPWYATEKAMSNIEFLEAVCKEAGLEKDYWKQPKVELYKFEVKRFVEK